jgi:hypothetical protein
MMNNSRREDITISSDKESKATLANIENESANNGKILLYHGNPDPDFKPYYGGGKDYHDYGNGLYCVYGTVKGLDLAKEWACRYRNFTESFIYVYEFDAVGLSSDSILNFIDYEPIYWLSAIAQHRFSNETAIQRKRRTDFVKMFPVDCESPAIIKGWRADDRYYAYLNLFLILAITYEAVCAALKLGNLGYQFVVNSENSYMRCKFIEKIHIKPSEYKDWSQKYQAREKSANEELMAVRDIEGRLLSDIMAKGGL